MNFRRVALVGAAFLVVVVAAFGVARAAGLIGDDAGDRVVVVGDSMVYGSGAAAGYGSDLDGRLLNGVAGWVGGPGQGPLIDPWRENLSDMLRRVDAGVVVLDACCNGYTDSAEWRAELVRIADVAGRRRVIAVTTPMPESASWFANLEADVRRANTDLRVVAAERGWEVVDLDKEWPVGTPNVHALDGLHLSDLAAKLAAERIANVVQKAG